jgi:2-keto-3-deoxy-6-phosphogluconate aldolase
MALSKFGFIVTGAGLDPARHRVTMSSGAFEMIAVGVAKPEQGVAVALALVSEGVQLIELCGGFGPLWTARVIEAIKHAVPVGSVGYGPESIDAMYALFSD